MNRFSAFLVLSAGLAATSTGALPAALGFDALLSTASAAPSATVVEQVNTLLNAPEYVPTAADWKRVGPDGAAVLRTIARNPKVLVVKRSRAAVSLLHFPSADTSALLRELVTSTKTPRFLRGKGAVALAVHDGATALPILQPLLVASHKRLREAAIRAVIRIDDSKARAALSAHLKVESNGTLRKVIERHLSKGGA